MTAILSIMLAVILTNNYVLAQFLGICPFLGVSKKLDSAVGMGVAVTFVMLLATAVTWPIQMYVLNTFNIGYLQTLVFILVIASLVQLVEMTLKKYMPPLYNSLGVFLPLITTNCAVLGVTIQNIPVLLHRRRSWLPAGNGTVRRTERETGKLQRHSGMFPGSSYYTDHCIDPVHGIHGILRCG